MARVLWTLLFLGLVAFGFWVEIKTASAASSIWMVIGLVPIASGLVGLQQQAVKSKSV